MDESCPHRGWFSNAKGSSSPGCEAFGGAFGGIAIEINYDLYQLILTYYSMISYQLLIEITTWCTTMAQLGRPGVSQPLQVPQPRPSDPYSGHSSAASSKRLR